MRSNDRAATEQLPGYARDDGKADADVPPRPQGSRHPVAGGGDHLAWSPSSWFFVRNASENMVKAGIASGFQLPVARLRHRGAVQPHRLQAQRHHPGAAVDRHRQYAAGLGRRRSSVATVDRLHGRPAAAVAQLAAVDPGRLLHRVRAQHPAAVLRAVLVLRRARRPADAAREHELPRHRLPQPPRPVDPDAQRRHGPAAGAARDRSSWSPRNAGSRAGRGRGRRGPAAISRPGWWASCCAARCRSLAFVCGGRADHVGRADPARLQLSRRLRAGAGVRGAVRGALDLHRGLHRRGRARRHPVGAAGPDRRRPRARPHAGPHRAPGRDPAGHAGDHPADHQPVSQPDQELLVRRRHRLSRDRGGVHGLGAGLDRPVDRDHRHHARRSTWPRASPCRRS